jgi:LacI family transcriptional regulator
MRSHGLSTARRVLAVDAWSIDSARDTALRLLTANPGITAILAANDQLAIGAIEAARSMRRRCPQDLSVVGYNDMPFMDLVDPPLTTVRVPQYDVGSESARLMLSLLLEQDATPLKQVRLTPELVVRGSTARCRPQRT